MDRGLKLVGESLWVKEITKVIELIKDQNVPILITGETGTGKELIARIIHFTSIRKDNAFIPVSCASIPHELFESELFGHKKGSFTGAVSDKEGLIEAASFGTLFLDEVDELSPSAQSKLLRTLDTGEVRRIGETEFRYVDFRLIAATSKDLRALSEQNKFRIDLFFRIDVVSIHCIPLRDRKEDIIPITKYYITQFEPEMRSDEMTKEAKETLISYYWPGNVRELIQEIKYAILHAENGIITINSLSDTVKKGDRETPDIFPMKKYLREAKKEYALKILKMVNGNKKKAAEILKIDYATLYRILNQ